MRRSALFVVGLACLLVAGTATGSEGDSPHRNASSADRPPRKVVVGTTIFNPGGEYPGLTARLKTLGGLIDEMSRQAGQQYAGRDLDLAILPEDAVTSASGPASARAIPLAGPVQETFSALARKHKTYLIVPLDLAETGPNGPFQSNAAVLFDRQGAVVGIYRKTHPVACVGSDEMEAGITPGREDPVFDCDFGKLGIQICWDMQFDEGWETLARKSAELVVWPTASPATALPAARAASHRYYVVSCTWRNNATIYEPTGMVAGRVEDPDRILVRQLDLSHAILGWSSFLNNGKTLADRYGDKVGYHYDPREDMGLFWSNDPETTIGAMIRSIGGEEIDQQVERNRRLYQSARGENQPAPIRTTARKPADRIEVAGEADGVTLTVTSESGIGGATIERTGDKWPDRITVRLRLRGLESIKLSNGTVTVAGTGSVAGEPSAHPTVVRDGQAEQPLDRESPLWMNATGTDDRGRPASKIPLEGGCFEFQVPRGLLETNPKTITLEWIDFYR